MRRAATIRSARLAANSDAGTNEAVASSRAAKASKAKTIGTGCPPDPPSTPVGAKAATGWASPICDLMGGFFAGVGVTTFFAFLTLACRRTGLCAFRFTTRVV